MTPLPRRSAVSPSPASTHLAEPDPTSVIRVIERLHAAVNKHDAEAVAALCDPDVVWTDPAAPEPLHGRAAVHHFHRDIMFRAIPDTRIQVFDGPYLSRDGTGATVRLRISGTMTGPLAPPGFAPTGGPIEFETAEFSRATGGLLTHHTVVLDMLGLARQIGAVPEVGSFTERIGVWLQRIAARRMRRQYLRPSPPTRVLRGTGS